VMAIATLDRVWVLAEVLERQAAWIEAGQLAEVELEHLPGQRLQGTVDYVYPELDRKTRTLKVRMRFDNEAYVLRPNMFARITIYGTETPAVVHVPRAALIRGGAIDRVVLSLGKGRFRSQAVEIGIESGDRVEIRSGITAGDLIVTSGQFLIDSESNIEAELARHPELDRSRIEIVEATEVIGMADKPLVAIRRKQNSSIVLGLGLQKAGKSDAFVSSGSHIPMRCWSTSGHW
ncbi:MAG: efflux RND transporter periplasmic adaptor subunit, partial [Planctomycetes bacterium]|nr:efflux RND transporter periplasmic adaptor subunit [Planctomycetota bacterium]